jgi:signal transduction histidine kinase
MFPNMRVLLVDDVPAQLTARAGELGGLRCQLVLAHDGAEALRLMAEGGVAVAVVTVQMAAMNGYEVARRARGNPATRNVPIVFIAAAAAPDSQLLEGFDLGTVDLLPAPPAPTLLRNKVQQFLHLASVRQRLEEEAADRRRVLAELEAFHHAVAHDLRASLRPLDGLSEALLDDYSDDLDGQEKDYLFRIRTAAARMERLIDDLVQLARVGHATIRRQPIDLSALVASVVDELRDTEPHRSFDLVPAPELTSYADGRLLRIAIESLLRSQRSAERLELGRRAGDEPIFYIRDVSPSRGVTQAIVDRVIRRHNGRAWTESSPDRGSTFYFTLPDDRH